MSAPDMASSTPATEPQSKIPTSQPNPAPTSEAVPSEMSLETVPPATPSKRIHSLVLDTGPLIKNEISISTLIAQAEELYTIPSVVSEIRDEATRSRFQTTLVPFLKFRSPRPESVQFVSRFARRTGDLEVLSKPDIQLLALTYELECERNGGDWRLRREPTQKTLNGKPPSAEEKLEDEKTTETAETAEPSSDVPQQPERETEPTSAEPEVTPAEPAKPSSVVPQQPERETEAPSAEPAVTPAESTESPTEEVSESIPEAMEKQVEILSLESPAAVPISEQAKDVEEASSEDDGEGDWITPSNIKKHQARENTSSTPEPIQRVLQSALLTTDMAMRNVALRINLNLLDPTFQRVTYLKTWVLRCHGCFKICKNLSKQFCPNCGQATLTRVSCSTNAAGNFTIHLKKNFQWNNRGNVFSIPKPTHGSANGKLANVKGGGKNGWGTELILAEDQKEYTRKVEENQRTKYKDVMDEDYLPGILTGDRKGGPGKIRVGAGRNVNSRKR